MVLSTWACWCFKIKTDNVHPLALCRGMLLVLRLKRIRIAAGLLLNTLASPAFMTTMWIFLAVVIQGAVLALMIFMEKLSAVSNNELSIDDFKDAFVHIFVYLTTAENYVDLTKPSKEISMVYFMFWIPVCVAGALFLMSLIISTFQNMHDTEEEDRALSERERRNAWNCYAAAFAETVWDEEVIHSLQCVA